MPRVFGLVIALVAAPALADSNDQTEYHFGFIAGAAVGEVGEREVQSRITGRLGKRAGTFNLLSHKLEAEFVPVQNFRLSLGSYLTHHHIAGVPGLDDRRSGRFGGVSVGLKYQLLDRAQAPFGLAIEAEPQWRRVDGASGTPIDEFGGQYWLMVDKELVPNRVLGVLNVVYEPEASRSRITGAWSHESTIRFAGAILAEAVPNFFLGAEGRYLRTYEGLGFDRFAGHALYLGPTVSAKLPGGYWLLATWNFQVAGRSVEEPAALDLRNFERHQFRLKFGFNY
jgi:hypothetical protein